MKTLYMTKGLPASGKTTAAKALIATQPGTKRVNKDDLRGMVDAGRWSEANEKFILQIRNQLVTDILTNGFHVIVDDTNLAPKHENALRGMAKELKAKFKVLDFTHVSPEECITRDLARPNSVGSKVIMGMYDQYLRVDVPPPIIDPGKTPAIIVDIDGTVADMNTRKPFDWDKVREDVPRKIVMRAVKELADSHDAEIIFVSGRDAVCGPQTKEWLWEHFNLTTRHYKLFMRIAGDQRRDSIVKREIYEAYIRPLYNVVAVFDDRPQVIRECWQALGFGDRIFNVGNGREF